MFQRWRRQMLLRFFLSNKIHSACMLGGRTHFRKHASQATKWSCENCKIDGYEYFKGRIWYDYIGDLSKAYYIDDLIF